MLADIAPHGTVKTLRSDGGGEFKAQGFRDILLNRGIRHEFGSPYTPRHQGHIEVTWRTIMANARAFMFDSNLPMYLWPYAVKHAVYIMNRTLNKRTNCTPLQMATGRIPNLAKIPLFGCKCYSYQQFKTKLEPRASVGIFIGFDSHSPAKFIYDPHTGQINRVQDVKFLDELYYKYKQKNQDTGDRQSDQTNPFVDVNRDVSTETIDSEQVETQPNLHIPDRPDQDNVQGAVTPNNHNYRLRQQKAINYDEDINFAVAERTYVDQLHKQTHCEEINHLNADNIEGIGLDDFNFVQILKFSSEIHVLCSGH